MNRQRQQSAGFVLATVLVLLLVVAAGALLLVEGGSTDTALADRTQQGLEADYVAQSALQHALAVANASSCGGYGLSSGMLGGNSYGATFSPTDGSPVTVTATATTAAGIQRTLVRTTEPVFQQMVSTTLSPTADSFIEGEDGHHDHNKATDRHLRTNSGADKIDRSLLQFDLSAIPTGSKILGATLRLYLDRSDGSDSLVEAFALTEAWVESEVTWNQATDTRNWTGGDFASTVYGSYMADGMGWKTMDLTLLAQRWVDQPTANHGVILSSPSASGDNKKEYVSSDDADASLHPSLIISYACECGVVCGGSTSNGPFAHWKLDDSSGGKAVDSIGDRNGELFNGPTWIEAGKVDGALSFDGNDDYVEVPHDDALPFTSEFSVALWARTNGAFTSQRLLSKEPTGSNDGFWLALQAGYLFVGVGGDIHTPPDAVVPDEWHHIAVTFSDDADRLVIYLDGAVVLDETVTATIAANTASLIMGSNWEGKTFAGPIDDVRIYDRELPAVEVAELAGVVPGELAHWPMDEASEFTANDVVGNHHGFLVEGAAWDKGYSGSGIRFSTAKDAVVVPHQNSLTFTDALTVSAWVMSDGFGGYDLVLSKGNGAPSINYYFGTLEDEMLFGFQGASSGQFTTSNLDLATGTWHHIAASFDAATDEVVLFHNGTVVAKGTSTAELPGNESNLYIGSSGGGSNWNGVLDDVRLFNVALSEGNVAELAAGGGGSPGGGAAPYVETYAQITPTVSGAWAVQDLSAFGVPANAVVEIAIVNDDIGNQRIGGVRAVGSTLERRMDLQEAEPGGRDVVVLHVQADAQSRIEYYAQRTDDIYFVLLGYWTVGAYQEGWATFESNVSNSWTRIDLSPYGAPGNAVVEIAIQNRSTNSQLIGGVRGPGTPADRHFNIHEAEGGGADLLSLYANADADGVIEVFSQASRAPSFHYAGYWSEPPGNYVEHHRRLGSPASASTWQSLDLSGIGSGRFVPQIVLANASTSREAEMGLRSSDGVGQRTLLLHEAEGGGYDLATMSIYYDDSTTVEWFSDRPSDHEFWLSGWWVLD